MLARRIWRNALLLFSSFESPQNKLISFDRIFFAFHIQDRRLAFRSAGLSFVPILCIVNTPFLSKSSKKNCLISTCLNLPVPLRLTRANVEPCHFRHQHCHHTRTCTAETNRYSPPSNHSLHKVLLHTCWVLWKLESCKCSSPVHR